MTSTPRHPSRTLRFAITLRKTAIFAAVALLTYVLIVFDTRAASSIAAISNVGAQPSLVSAQ